MVTREQVAGDDDRVLFADGLDVALIGATEGPGPDGQHRRLAVYSIEACIDVLAAGGLSYEEAEEHFGFNTLGAYVGPQTPVYVRTRFEEDDMTAKYLKLTERNDQEGETWHFYIPRFANGAQLQQLEQLITAIDAHTASVVAADGNGGSDLDEPPFTIFEGELTEDEVDTLVKHANDAGGYMPAHTKLEGLLTVPDFTRKRPENLEKLLYKGHIRKMMKVAAK